MSRVLIKIYSYECDMPGCKSAEEVTRGDSIPSFFGATYPNLRGTVHSTEDADRVMRYRFRWKIGRNFQSCPRHEHD